MLSGTNRRILTLRGTYRGGSGRRYGGGVYYDTLKSEEGSEQMTLIVPEALKPRLSDGFSYELRGVLSLRMDDEGACRLQFRVSEVVRGDAAVRAERERREEALLSRKVSRNVSEHLRNLLVLRRPPRVVLVYGQGSIVDQDFLAQLGDAASSYELIETRVSMTDPAALAQMLAGGHQGGDDLIALVRGGGRGLDALNDLSLAEAALALPVPLVTALGHEADNLLIERVADLRLSTPSHLGRYLAQLAHTAGTDLVDVRARIARDLEESYRVHIEGLQEAEESSEAQVRKLKWRLERTQSEVSGRRRALPLLLLLVGLLLGTAGATAYLSLARAPHGGFGRLTSLRSRAFESGSGG